MKVKKLITNFIIISLMGTTSALKAETKKPPATPLIQNSTANATFESYRRECAQRAKQQGLTADVAADLCNCTIKKFQQTYNLNQFRALVQKSKTDKTAARNLTQVGEACFDEVLYE
ncbi:MAG: hypothetical protein N5P05_001068 [Chroococcopsis gigantea SAG 12.99]|jgi:hypothetical protein|nr:hypothetical protein [Chroococcopsis gigantea SAG 12.99]